MVRPNLYDDIIGLSGGQAAGGVSGQERILTGQGAEIIRTPSTMGATPTGTATGRTFDMTTGILSRQQPNIQSDIRNISAGIQTGTGASAVSQFLGGAGMAPSMTMPSEAELLRDAQSRFTTLFGDDPNFDSMLQNYTETIRNLTQEGQVTLEQARALADERFGIAGERLERGFREGQRSLAEQAFLGERAQQQSLIERGLGGSGISQLGTVQQRIAQGDQVSRLYSQFLDSSKQLALQEAETDLNFAQALNQLNQAAELQILQEKQRIDGMRMQYNQWRGSTIQQLSQAARTNNIQDFQLKMQEWESGLQYASLLDQESRDSAQTTIQTIQSATDTLIAEIEANRNLSTKDKQDLIAEARRNSLIEINKVTSSIGLTTPDLVSNILGGTVSATSAPSLTTPQGMGITGTGQQTVNPFQQANIPGVTQLTPEQLARLEAAR